MKKYLIIGIVVIVLAAAGYYAYKRFSPPSFLVRSFTGSTGEGTFEVDGISNNFGFNTRMTVGAKNGSNPYSVEQKPIDSTTIVFNLLKNGVFVKELDRRVKS